MRRNPPIVPPKDSPRWLYEILRRLNASAQDSAAGIAAIGRGETPDGSGTPLLDTTAFFKLAGRPGGQMAHGATEAQGSLTLSSTFSDSKGLIYFGSSQDTTVYNESEGLFGIGTTSPQARIHTIASAGGGSVLQAASDVSAIGVGGNSGAGGDPNPYGTLWQCIQVADDYGSYITSDQGGTAVFGLSGGASSTYTSWTVSFRARRLFGLTIAAGSTMQFRIHLNNGKSYLSDNFDITVFGDSWQNYTHTIAIVGAGSPSVTPNRLEILIGLTTFFRYPALTYVDVRPTGVGDPAEAATFQSTIQSGANVISVRTDTYANILFRVTDAGRTYLEDGSGNGTYLLGSTDTFSAYAKTTDTLLLQARTSSIWSDTVASSGLYIGDNGGTGAARGHMASNATTKFTRFGISSTATVISDAAPSALRAPSTGSPTLLVENSVTVTDVVLQLRGMSAQTGNLLEFSDNGTVRASHRFDGKLFISHPTTGGSYASQALIRLEQDNPSVNGVAFLSCYDVNTATEVFAVGTDGAISTTALNLTDASVGGTSTANFAPLNGIPWSAGFSLYIPDAGGTGSGTLVLDATSGLTFNVFLGATTRLISSTAGSGASFADTTNNNRKLRFVLSGASANNHSITLTNSAARNYGLGNLSGNIVIVGDDPPSVASGALGKVDLTGQTAAIGSTNLSNTPPAGLYLVEVYVVCTTASGSGAPNLDVTIGWTDVLGATTQKAVTAFSLAATGRTSGQVLCQVSSGNLSYSTTINSASGSPQYAVYIRVVSLG